MFLKTRSGDEFVPPGATVPSAAGKPFWTPPFGQSVTGTPVFRSKPRTRPDRAASNRGFIVPSPPQYERPRMREALSGDFHRQIGSPLIGSRATMSPVGSET